MWWCLNSRRKIQELGSGKGHLVHTQLTKTVYYPRLQADVLCGNKSYVDRDSLFVDVGVPRMQKLMSPSPFLGGIPGLSKVPSFMHHLLPVLVPTWAT